MEKRCLSTLVPVELGIPGIFLGHTGQEFSAKKKKGGSSTVVLLKIREFLNKVGESKAKIFKGFF